MSFYQKYNKSDQIQTEYKLMKNGIINKRADKSEIKNLLIDFVPKLKHTDFSETELTKEGLKKVTEYVNYVNDELNDKRCQNEDGNEDKFSSYRRNN